MVPQGQIHPPTKMLAAHGATLGHRAMGKIAEEGVATINAVPQLRAFACLTSNFSENVESAIPSSALQDMRDQDLAALKHIPHVYLGLQSFSTFRLTNGSWRSLHLHGPAGFSIDFSCADAFFKYTRRFHFEGISMTAEGMQGVLQEASMRQDVALHQCVHTLTCEGLPTEITMTSLSNVKLCRAPEYEKLSMIDVQHDKVMHLHGYWPDRAAYPELYKQEQ